MSGTTIDIAKARIPDITVAEPSGYRIKLGCDQVKPKLSVMVLLML